MRLFGKGALVALLTLLLLSGTVIAAPAAPSVDKAPPTVEGLSMLSEGGAVFYGPAWDNGGWDQIVQRHLAWGQAPAGFTYRDDGQWCVHPDYAFGDILTLRNPNTGVTLTCTVGDAVAPQDQANWRRHAVIEVAWNVYQKLGLDQANDVQVWYMPNG